MPVNITLAIAWNGPIHVYDIDDIIDVFPYNGNVAPAPANPWVHIHCLNAPFDTLVDAKNALLVTNEAEYPADPPPDYEPVIVNMRAMRAHKNGIPNQVKNALNRDRTYEFDFTVIADSKIYNKKLQRLMELADWGL